MSMKFIVIAVVYVLVATTAVSAMPIGTSPIVSHNIESFPNSDGVGKLEARTPGFGFTSYNRVPTNDPEHGSHELEVQPQKHDDHGHASNACVPTANPSQAPGKCVCPSVCTCNTGTHATMHVASQASESSHQDGQVVGGHTPTTPGSHTNQNVPQPGRMVPSPTSISEQERAAHVGYIQAQTMSMIRTHQQQQNEREKGAEDRGCAYGCMCGLATGLCIGAVSAHYCL